MHGETLKFLVGEISRTQATTLFL